MSFAEFEREVALQGKVMAISRVYLKDETPTHTFGCFFFLFYIIIVVYTIVTGLGF